MSDPSSPNGGKPVVVPCLDILQDMDDASHAIYNAAGNLRQVGLPDEAKELVSLADQVLEKTAALRKKYGRI